MHVTELISRQGLVHVQKWRNFIPCLVVRKVLASMFLCHIRTCLVVRKVRFSSDDLTDSLVSYEFFAEGVFRSLCIFRFWKRIFNI